MPEQVKDAPPMPFEQFREHYGFNAGSALYTLSKENAAQAARIASLEARVREAEREVKEWREKNALRCGKTILSDKYGRVYGCSKLKDHDGYCETVKERYDSSPKPTPSATTRPEPVGERKDEKP